MFVDCFIMVAWVQCNNPKTKEPKLDAAMRIIPEWKSRDVEIRRLWDSVYSQNRQTPSSSSKSSSDSTSASRSASSAKHTLSFQCILHVFHKILSVVTSVKQGCTYILFFCSFLFTQTMDFHEI